MSTRDGQGKSVRKTLRLTPKSLNASKVYDKSGWKTYPALALTALQLAHQRLAERDTLGTKSGR